MGTIMKGKRVMVTGASSGIGEACARAFAGAGSHLILVARRLERIESLARTLVEEHGVQVRTGQLDVRDRIGVESFVSTLAEPWNAIDVLVNNAGLARGLEPLFQGSIEDWEEMLDTNVKGLLYVTRTVLVGMVARSAGHVINIGSIAGHEVYPGGNVYCASKHAVTALNRALNIDVLGTGVRVSSVDPGMVETEFSVVRFRGDEVRAEKAYRGFEALSGEDVADAVLYCATRPPHANVRELILMPSAQGSSVHSHRR